MYIWEAALIVLYDCGPVPDHAVGWWKHHKTIAAKILDRKLVATNGRTFTQTVRTSMAVQGELFIERQRGARDGCYRIINRDAAREYLERRKLWCFTDEAQRERDAVLEQRERAAAEQAANAERAEQACSSQAHSPQQALGQRQRDQVRSKTVRQRLIPEEVIETACYLEGAVARITVNAYERNKKARRLCLNHHGYKCAVCGFDFVAKYGSIGKDYIHVHHHKRLARQGGRYTLDPVRDLCPICPNCHAMIHQKDNPYTIKQLQAIIQQVEKDRGKATRMQ
jgi:hypothetical protein